MKQWLVASDQCDGPGRMNNDAVLMTKPDLPPLKPLHLETILIATKLALFQQLPTEAITNSLLPGQQGALKTRPDGTILDGHHRIHVLRTRGVNVDKLPREIVAKTEL